MTASSQVDKFHGPSRARLRIKSQGRLKGAWTALHNKHNQWLKVDLGQATLVTGIETQGSADKAEWVTAYYVYYSMDGMYFSRVTHWWDYIKVYARCFYLKYGIIEGSHCCYPVCRFT